ncbi:MAG: PorT family protein [Fibrobacter sp.]|nr:PorT family protein [Fibrobacter sp.]
MKKIILLAAAVLMAASASFAQFNLGGRAAINFGTVWGDNTEDVPWGFGFNAGLATKIGINDMFAVAPEVTIDLRRSSDAVITWSTWAIDIPVLARINLMPALYLEVGPQFAIILSSEAEMDYILGTTTINYGDADILNTFEIGLAAGAGYSITPNLDVNFRLALGFTSILDDSKNDDFEEADMEAADADDFAAAFNSFDDMMNSSLEDNSASAAGGKVKNLQFQVGVTYWFM